MYGHFSALKKSAERTWLFRCSVRVSRLATSILTSPRAWVGPSSAPSNEPSNLLKLTTNPEHRQMLGREPYVRVSRIDFIPDHVFLLVLKSGSPLNCPT